MDVHDDHAYRGAARRRRERRLRAFLHHEKLSLAMQLATVSHHSWHRAGRADVSTQTMTFSDAATFAATASPAATCAATPAPVPEIEHVIPAPVATHVVPAPVFEHVVPAPVIENVAPAPAVPSPQLLPAYTMTTVNPGISFDITGLVSPQFSSTAMDRSLFHFLLLKSLLRPCTIKSIRNRSLQGR